jgi:hypothetical protein
MVLVSRGWLFAVFAAAVAFVLAIAVAAFLLVSAAPGRMADEGRLLAEDLLYLGFLLALALTGGGVLVLVRGLSVSRELDRIIEFARAGSQPVEDRLRRLGALGGRIRALNAALADVSERRLVRISALNATVSYLVANSALPLALVDVTGRVAAASPAFLSKLRIEGKPPADLADMLPGLDFPAVVAGLERDRTPMPWNEGSESCGFHPLFDRRNELATVVCVLGKMEAQRAKVRERLPEPASTSRLLRLMQRYLPRRNHSQREE